MRIFDPKKKTCFFFKKNNIKILFLQLIHFFPPLLPPTSPLYRTSAFYTSGCSLFFRKRYLFTSKKPVSYYINKEPKKNQEGKESSDKYLEGRMRLAAIQAHNERGYLFCPFILWRSQTSTPAPRQ